MRATQTEIVERLSRSVELVVLDEIQPESGKAVPAARRRSQNLHVSTSGSNLRCGLCPGNSYGFHVNQPPPLCPEWISTLQESTF